MRRTTAAFKAAIRAVANDPSVPRAALLLFLLQLRNALDALLREQFPEEAGDLHQGGALAR